MTNELILTIDIFTASAMSMQSGSVYPDPMIADSSAANSKPAPVVPKSSANAVAASSNNNTMSNTSSGQSGRESENDNEKARGNNKNNDQSLLSDHRKSQNATIQRKVSK